MATFVLIAGAWHGAWCWQRVTPLLVSAGHRVLAPDLLGMGADETPLAKVTLEAWADQIAAVVEREARPVILVAHSRGGIVISEVAERCPDRIASLVYVAGSLIPDGDTVFANVVEAKPDDVNILHMRDDGAGLLPEAYLGPAFYNETAAEWLAVAKRHVTYEPLWTHATPLKLTRERFGRVKRAYVETLHDNAIPLAKQRSLQAALPCDPVFTLHSDHAPYFSKPDELAGCLLAVAA